MTASPPSPPPKGSRVKTVRKRMADGTIREYRYDRETRKRLPGPGAIARKRLTAPVLAGVQALTAAYRRSTEFERLAPRTQANHERELEWLDRLEDTDPRTIRRAQILGLRDIVNKKRGPGAANVFLSVMSTFFDWALQRGAVDLNPVSGIGRLEGGELPPWTEKEARKVMTPGVVPEAVRRAVVLAYFTGQRRGDLVALTWAAYDGRRIRLTQEKTGVELVLPVEPELKGELDAWQVENRAAHKPSIHILTSSRGSWTPNALSHAVQREIGKVEGVRPGLNMHGLRKRAATRLAEAGCSVHEIAAITGHKTIAMVQHYTKAVDQERMAGAAILRLKTGFRVPTRETG